MGTSTSMISGHHADQEDHEAAPQQSEPPVWDTPSAFPFPVLGGQLAGPFARALVVRMT